MCAEDSNNQGRQKEKQMDVEVYGSGHFVKILENS
jgi:hypothetical protein